MEKTNGTIMQNNACWYVLRTLPKTERKLMRSLHTAGCVTYCPLQTVFINWKGAVKEVIAPLFPGWLFVKGDVSNDLDIVTLQAAFLMDNDGNKVKLLLPQTELVSQLLKVLE